MIRYFNDPPSGAGAALMAVLDQSQDCVKLLTLEGRVRFMNNAGLRALEIAVLEDVLDRAWESFWPDAACPAVRSAIHAAKAGERARFEAECPAVTGEQRWWDVAVTPIADPVSGDRFILVTERDITQTYLATMADREARAEAEALAHQLAIVSEEMAHRLKNLLSIVGAIATMTARSHDDIDSFMTMFQSRLSAVGRSQSLLTGSQRLLSIADIMEPLLDGMAPAGRLRCGPLPDVALDEQSVRTLALVLNELTTNAHKYGAFAGPEGTVDLVVSVAGTRADFLWQEQGKTMIPAHVDAPPHSGRGAGHRLIERLCRATGNSFSIDWRADGLDVHFTLSL